jgi:NADPH-dependent 2,4-dienoyl-CoA reductase/sulfur reductase-like enzyme
MASAGKVESVAERLIVVGGDAAGMSAATTARRRDPELKILAFERGPYTSYSACGIPYYIGGHVDRADRLLVRGPEQFREAGIEVETRTEVVAIDLEGRTVRVRAQDGGREREEGWDRLVYAAGAEAVVPPIPGAEATEPVRTVDAAERFRAALLRSDDRAAVVIGAGYIGLEMAEALVQQGLEVTLLDRLDQVFPGLDPDMAVHVRDAAEGVGIRVMLSTQVEEIRRDDDGRVRSVLTSDGELRADHVVLSTGVRPATDLARRAGLRVGETGALEVDDGQRCAGVAGVYAAGDCVESWHRVLRKAVNVQLGTHANKQGRVAGANATGGDARFPGVIGTAVSRICSSEVGRTGLSEREAADAGLPVVSAVVKDKTRAGYYPGSGPVWVKLLAEPGTGRLLGGQIVGVEGSAKRIDVLAACVWAGMTVGDMELMDLSYAPPFSGVYDPVLVAARQTAKAVREAG